MEWASYKVLVGKGACGDLWRVIVESSCSAEGIANSDFSSVAGETISLDSWKLICTLPSEALCSWEPTCHYQLGCSIVLLSIKSFTEHQHQSHSLVD